MKTQLEAAVISVRDLQDQPDSPYVLLVSSGSGGTTHAFAVDDIEITTSGERAVAITGLLAGTSVVQFPAGARWQLLSRAVLEIVPVQEAIGRLEAERAEVLKFKSRLGQDDKEFLQPAALNQDMEQLVETPFKPGGYL